MRIILDRTVYLPTVHEASTIRAGEDPLVILRRNKILAERGGRLTLFQRALCEQEHGVYCHMRDTPAWQEWCVIHRDLCNFSMVGMAVPDRMRGRAREGLSSLDRVSVPVWLIILSDQLLIVALVGLYPTN